MQRGKHMRGHRHAIDIFDELNVSVLAYKQAVHLYMMLTNWIRLIIEYNILYYNYMIL